ncbi:MAG: murein biosynthesis integral membrane protein MurJ [Ardenticatenales bacterium]|nr:murein biosynthesis integral membrane protein MurJ [Ardenticatenales bacterium]
MSRNSFLARAALIVMVGFLLAKVTAIGRQLIIASAFGATASMDAYFAAFTAPDLIFMLISGGALSAAFIPVFSEYLNRNADRDEAWRMASNVLTVSFILSLIAATLAALFAPAIIRTVVAPQFTAEQQQLTVALMRLILVSTVIFSLSGLVTGVLHTLQHFLLPAFAPVVYNLGIIIGALAVAPLMPEGQRVYGLAIGSIIGALFHLSIQLPALIKHRARLRPIFDLGDEGLRQVVVLMAPRAAALALIYSKFIMRTNFASRLPEGQLSALDYAWDLMQLPETIFGTAIALAVFPTMAELWSQQNRAQLAKTFNDTLRSILTLTVPAAVGMWLLSLPVVRAFYERGAFGYESSLSTAYALSFFAFGIVGHSLLEVVARLYYAQKDMLRPLYAAAAMLIVTIGLAWWLLGDYGIGGIALADTVGVFVEVLILLWWLRHRLPEAQDGSLLMAVAKVVVAAFVMGVALYGWLILMDGRNLYLVAGGGILVGAAVYGVVALMLGIEEIKRAPRLLLRRG